MRCAAAQCRRSARHIHAADTSSYSCLSISDATTANAAAHLIFLPAVYHATLLPPRRGAQMARRSAARKHDIA